jgi:hypothetical protein
MRSTKETLTEEFNSEEGLNPALPSFMVGRCREHRRSAETDERLLSDELDLSL